REISDSLGKPCCSGQHLDYEETEPAAFSYLPQLPDNSNTDDPVRFYVLLFGRSRLQVSQTRSTHTSSCQTPTSWPAFVPISWRCSCFGTVYSVGRSHPLGNYPRRTHYEILSDYSLCRAFGGILDQTVGR